jgi:hypothetical protein
MEKETKAVKTFNSGKEVIDFVQGMQKKKTATAAEHEKIKEVLMNADTRGVFTVIKKLSDAALDNINTADVFTRESLKADVAFMYVDYGYPDAPQIERHMIEHVVACYIRLWVAEREYSSILKEEHTLTRGAYWDKKLSMIQTRYLRAVEMLARVRRVKLPNVQINIADKQINTSG